MNQSEFTAFNSLHEALWYVGLTSGLYINESLLLVGSQPKWPSTISVLPLILGLIGFIFNIFALVIFTTSKIFRQNSFRYYIYAFILVNCGSISTHSWIYLLFYLLDPIQLCKYLQYLQQSTATASLWIMVLLSLERSFTFLRPFAVKKLLQNHVICLVLIVVTCLCFVLHIDELLSVEIKAFRWVNFAYGLCSIKRRSRLAGDRIKIITHSHSFIFPFLLNSILDAYICYKICERRKRLTLKSASILQNNNNNSNKNKHRRTRKSLAHEITLTLLCQSMWLLFTYFPTHLYYFLISFNVIGDHDRDNSTFNFFVRQNLLIYLAFSPTLYVILSPTLRKEIYSYMCRSYKKNKSTDYTSVSNVQHKLRQYLIPKNHHYRSQHASLPGNLTILITSPENALNRHYLKSENGSFQTHFESRSVPCLHLFNEKSNTDYNQKTERSNTINE